MACYPNKIHHLSIPSRLAISYAYFLTDVISSCKTSKSVVKESWPIVVLDFIINQSLKFTTCMASLRFLGMLCMCISRISLFTQNIQCFKKFAVQSKQRLVPSALSLFSLVRGPPLHQSHKQT